MKAHISPLVISLIVLGACGPEKKSVNNEVPAIKEVTSIEQKIAKGQPVYEANCAGCHDSGVAGAPKPGDKEAWNQRRARGMDEMVKKSIEGFEGKTGVMPPKGNNTSLSDDDIANAVAYMVRTIQ
ncbi:MAG: c-type cytochrome [Chlorobiaceae bacterium]